MACVNIEWQDQFGRWQRYQAKHNQADAFRTPRPAPAVPVSGIAWWMNEVSCWICWSRSSGKKTLRLLNTPG